MFTINRPGLPSSLRRYLGTTNVIDNGHSATRYRMQRVKNWQNGPASNNDRGSPLDRSGLRSQLKNYRRIMGYEQLWILKAALEEPAKDQQLVQQTVAG